MRSISAAMVEDVRVLATGILQRIRQNRHRREVAGFVHTLSQRENRGRAPRRIADHGPEWIAEDAPEQARLMAKLCSIGYLCHLARCIDGRMPISWGASGDCRSCG